VTDLATFDRAWRAKLSRELDRVSGEPSRREIMQDESLLREDPTAEEITAWTREMLDRMEARLGEAEQKDVLNACGCWTGAEGLHDLRVLYEQTRDLDLVLEKACEGLDAFLRATGASEAVLDEVHARGWGWPGRREGNTIYVTKIPFEGSIEAFFAESDPEKRRAMSYCHCPRVRDALKAGERLPKSYCHCSAGFYKKNYEEILRQPVDVEILETVLSGDEVCSFAVHLPPSVAPGEG